MCIIFKSSAKNSSKLNKFLHSEVNLLIQHIIVQDQDGQNNMFECFVKSSTFKLTHFSTTTLLVSFNGQPLCSMLRILSSYPYWMLFMVFKENEMQLKFNTYYKIRKFTIKEVNTQNEIQK